MIKRKQKTLTARSNIFQPINIRIMQAKPRIAIAHRAGNEATRIDFNFRVEPTSIIPLLGHIEMRQRTIEDEIFIFEERVTHLNGDREEATLYDRVDAVGNLQADTGGKIWDNGRQGHRMSFLRMRPFLQFSGYYLNNVYSDRKQGDKKAKLVFQFEQRETTEFAGKKELLEVFENLCQKTWLNTHIWDNRSMGNVTINPANAISPKIPGPELLIERTTKEGKSATTGEKMEREGIYFSCSSILMPEEVEEVA
jgi:hypothetical protein